MPNNDLISRTAAKNEFWALMKELTKATVEPLPDNAIGALAGYSIIENAPAVDAAPVIYAHWVDENPSDYMDVRMRCSACGRIDTPFADWDYCPHCGAKMNGGEDDAE